MTGSLVRAATTGARAVGRLATRRAGRGGGVVLCYHDIVADGAGATGLDVEAGALRRHLQTVRRLGFRFVHLEEISDRLLRGDDVDGLAAVAFDDALAGVARHGVPVLVELGVPATLMTVGTAWGRAPAWWPGVSPTMTRAELVEAVDHGLRLAAHTNTHASLPSLTPVQLDDEVAGCRAVLEDLTGSPVTQFAYPFGHHDPAVRAAVERAGYTAAYTFLNGRVRLGDDLHRLPRFTMGAHHSRARLAYHLARPASSWPDHQLDRVVGA